MEEMPRYAHTRHALTDMNASQVFDMPCLGSKPFTERLAKLHEIFPPGSPGPVIVVEHEACKNLEHLQTRLNDIIHEDAEG